LLQPRPPVPLGQVAHHLRFADRWDEWGVAAELAADHATALGNDAEAVRLLEAVWRDAPWEPARAGAIAGKLVPAGIESLRARDGADLGGPVPERAPARARRRRAGRRPRHRARQRRRGGPAARSRLARCALGAGASWRDRGQARSGGDRIAAGARCG